MLAGWRRLTGLIMAVIGAHDIVSCSRHAFLLREMRGRVQFVVGRILTPIRAYQKADVTGVWVRHEKAADHIRLRLFKPDRLLRLTVERRAYSYFLSRLFVVLGATCLISASAAQSDTRRPKLQSAPWPRLQGRQLPKQTAIFAFQNQARRW